VIISDDRVANIVSSRHSEPPSGARVVDGTGKFLIPGLWDMHVHGNNQPWFASVFPLYLANGVTGVREMFGPPDANQFRAELASLHTPAPHIYLASPIVDGHPKVWPNSVEVNSPDEAREFVRDQRRKGADFIKVYSRLKPQEYLAIMDESRRQHLPVAGHVPNAVSAWNALSAKQQSFEHLYGIAVACSTREAELFAKIGESKSFV
jgi:imidazolonepropionase-like amidohydrolase